MPTTGDATRRSGARPKRAAVLGEGQLAADTCDIVAAMSGWVLEAVVPDQPAPYWDIVLERHVRGRWPDARVIASGDWRELTGGHFDLVISVLYNRIIGRDLIAGCGRILNFHPGRLPEYRGVRPMNWALHNGERLHGVTIHEIDEGIDSGPILAQALFSIWPQIDEVRDVWDRSMAMGRLLMAETLPRLEQLTGTPQDESRAGVYFSSQTKDLGERAGWTRAESPMQSAARPTRADPGP